MFRLGRTVEAHAAKLLFVLAQERLGGPCVPAGQSAAAIEEGALAFSNVQTSPFLAIASMRPAINAASGPTTHP